MKHIPIYLTVYKMVTDKEVLDVENRSKDRELVLKLGENTATMESPHKTDLHIFMFLSIKGVNFEEYL